MIEPVKKKLRNWELKSLLMTCIIPVFISASVFAVLFNYMMAKESARSRIHDHIVERRTNITFIAHLPSLRMYLTDIRLGLSEEAAFLKQDLQVYFEDYLRSMQPISSYQVLSVLSVKGEELLRIENGETVPGDSDFSKFRKMLNTEPGDLPLPDSADSPYVTDILPVRSATDSRVLGGIIYKYKVPVSQFMENARKVLVFNITLSVCSILVALAIIYVILAIIIRPLKHLTFAARGMLDGDLSQDIKTDGLGEARVLAATFEAMRQRLKDQIEQLEENNRKLEAIIEFLPDATFIIGKERRVVFWNKAMEEMTGRSREEMIGKNDMEYAIPFYEERRPILIDIAFQEGVNKISPHRKGYINIRGHGNILRGSAWCQTTAGKNRMLSATASALYDDQGRIWGAIETVRDTTDKYEAAEEIRKLNEQLEQRVIKRTVQLETANRQLKESMEKAQKLARDAEAANISKGQFLANMSHEIRTPMNGIIGICDLAFSTSRERKIREYLNIIRISAKSLLGLINDILDFSRIEAGKLIFENIPFSPQEVVEEVCDIFFEKISEKDTELIVDIASDVPDKIISDPFRLRQVLINLTSNAFKFTDKGEICISLSVASGQLSVASGQLYNGQRATDNGQLTLLFSVRDTGIGIAPEMQTKLFDAFMQADGSTTRKYGGTGLGLAICKRIVNMMNGNIWVESQQDAGSSFYFTARFQTVPSEAIPEPPTVVPEGLKDLRVLLVEDNLSAQMVIRRFLESFGFRVETSWSAENALKIYDKNIRKEPFGLILIDFKLPGMDGISAAEKIRQDSRIQPPPIIIISGYIREKDIQRAREIGIESYLIKPVRQSLLFDTILELFGYKTSVLVKNDTGLACSEEFSDISVLLVEDHPINRRVATEILELAGISVDSAVNGLEAVKAVGKKKYDAVLMDIQMPEMDGFEATRQIRNQECGVWNGDYSEFRIPDFKSRIPVIAMTAHAMSGDREKCLKAGMNDYVAKPIDRKELFAALRRNISGPLSAVSGQLFAAGESGTTDNGVSSDFGELSRTVGRQLATDKQEIRIPALPGLDIGEGVERLGGSWELYADILMDFCNSQKEFIPEFQCLIETGDFESARIRAHSLKGAAGNVSAVKLKVASKMLEEACESREKGHILTLLRPVEDAFSQIDKAVEKIARDNEDGKDDPGDVEKQMDNHSEALSPGHLSELFEKLGRAIRDADPVESEYSLREIRTRVSMKELTSDLENLGKHIRNYDFDNAAAVLGRIARFGS
ncbi:response regulator [Desulfococcaceae bacterium HSG8]|nr:response regulator [Desulfococcaceae bacterium HSG8]